MAYKDMYDIVIDAEQGEVVYKIVPLAECINSIMFCGGKQYTFAYTERFHRPAGNGWVGREDIDDAGKRGMVWKQEVETKKDGSAA